MEAVFAEWRWRILVAQMELKQPDVAAITSELSASNISNFLLRVSFVFSLICFVPQVPYDCEDALFNMMWKLLSLLHCLFAVQSGEACK